MLRKRMRTLFRLLLNKKIIRRVRTVRPSGHRTRCCDSGVLWIAGYHRTSYVKTRLGQNSSSAEKKIKMVGLCRASSKKKHRGFPLCFLTECNFCLPGPSPHPS